MKTFDMSAGGDNGVDSNTTIDALSKFDPSKNPSKKIGLEVRAIDNTLEDPTPKLHPSAARICDPKEDGGRLSSRWT